MRNLKNTKTLCVCAHACRKIEKLTLHSVEQLPSTGDQLSEPCPAAHEGWLVSLDSPEYRVSALQSWQERRALGVYFEEQVTRVLEVSACLGCAYVQCRRGARASEPAPWLHFAPGALRLVPGHQTS